MLCTELKSLVISKSVRADDEGGGEAGKTRRGLWSVNTHLSIICQVNHCLTCGCPISGKDGEIHLKISCYVCHHGNIKHTVSLPHLIC